MEIKNGVILNGLSIKMRPVLIEADKIWKAAGEELVITGGLDGTHSAGSLHYYGLAVDLRTRYFTSEVAAQVFKDLQSTIPFDYDVILHSSHIHVEYDPKENV